jgi:hypothetical protein
MYPSLMLVGYIYDKLNNVIWRVLIGPKEYTWDEWIRLVNENFLYLKLSVTSDGRLLFVVDNIHRGQDGLKDIPIGSTWVINIYGSNGKVEHTIMLSNDLFTFDIPYHAVKTVSGNYVIGQRQRITEVKFDGEVIQSYCTKRCSDVCLDEEGRVYFSDVHLFQVMVLDPCFVGCAVILDKEIFGSVKPKKLLYSNGQLIVGTDEQLFVYNIRSSVAGIR